MNNLINNWKSFWERNEKDFFQTHKELCLIPAPSYYEDERAQYCKNWLEKAGAVGTYIDSAKNVIYPMNCEGSNQIIAVNAHTDTVFPMDTPLKFTDDGEIIRCPGVGDDTGCLATMLYVIKFFIEEKIQPKNGILFVCNSGEEGLGNLYGIRRFYQDYAGRIAFHIAIDGGLMEVVDRCVGSHRYNVTVLTEGGHSFSHFGNTNAIAEAAKIISRIYEIKVPEKAGTKTTYNVGTIQGGTSVNSIAQNVSFLCEYRSDDVECLDVMKKAFEKIFSEAQNEKVRLEIELVGERPCAKNVDAGIMKQLVDKFNEITFDVLGAYPVPDSGSTDCNIPQSLGIPAVCIGSMTSGGTHTREEWLEKASMIKGFELVVKYLNEYI